MKKDENKIKARVAYVRKRVADKLPTTSTTEIIKLVATELFLSESIIWKDYFSKKY